MAALIAFYDANVLYPSELRNFLMHLALTGLFRAKWSATVHEEWISNLLRSRPDLTRKSWNAPGNRWTNERVRAKTVVWTAGVTPSPAGKWLGTLVDHTGCVRIQTDLTVSEHPNIFVVGDRASLDQDGRALPGVAQVAIQQGKYAAMSILRRVRGLSPLPRFRDCDKSNLAVVGRNFAVLQSAGVQLSEFMAWLV